METKEVGPATAKPSRWMIWVIAPKQTRSGDWALLQPRSVLQGAPIQEATRHDGRVNPVDSTVEPKRPAILFGRVSWRCVCVPLRCRREGGKGAGKRDLGAPPPLDG